ncbi:MAG: hypothetical protein HFH45_01465 [Bacilli bacterium]|nr:hypothetical protein [Bacilli bacterium]
MIDICFVGNSSIDNIITKKGSYRTFGGSALYSAYSCRFNSDSNIAIISNISEDLKQKLEHSDISLIGNNNKLAEFEINEIDGTCVSKKCYDGDFLINDMLDINHLHVSFRKGVNIDKILNNPKIKYKSLSIDVMIHSVRDYIPYIKKYLNRIDILFCNLNEYSLIKDVVQEIPIKVITNEEKPVIAITENENLIFEIPNIDNIVSTTGAGDTFIGGFLSKYIKEKNLVPAVIQGINNSLLSIQRVGYLSSDASTVMLDIKVNKIPNNIIVIGNSCAGKTTFIEFIKKYFDIFVVIDDLAPLLETFMMDDLSISNDKVSFEKIKSEIKFMQDIYDEYISNYDGINHYSKISKTGNGHDIVRPILWDLILEKAVTVLQQKNNIIQFSRGLDPEYGKEIDTDIYGHSLELVLNRLSKRANTIIINLTSDLEIRKQRNIDRFSNGGHFVSEETMEQVYGKDIFVYEENDNNCGCIKINDETYPVVTIVNNKSLTPIELDKFLLYNLNKVIDYYNYYNKEV